MSTTTKRFGLTAFTLVAVLVLLLGGLSLSGVRAQEGQNLLVNGDFEGGSAGDAWPMQDGIPEIQVAPGWSAFWIDNPPPSYAVMPVHCGGDPGCIYWGRPEFRGCVRSADPLRIHSGNLAQKFHSFSRQMEAGIYQRVEGITPGENLHFQAWVQTWSCMAAEQWNVCPTGNLSNSPAPMHVRVGIDPTGGTNPWAGNIVWSAEGNAWDVYTLFQVEAVAEASAVTAFVYHRTDWQDGIYRPNNDVYVDDAALYYTAPPAPPTRTPAPPPPTITPGPSPTPMPPPTPRPDGAVVHIVQSGDTLFGIALQYGVPPEQIQQLNASSIGAGNMIWTGQELVISVAAVTPTVPPTVTLAVIPTPLAVAASSESGVCILAFHDRNGDGFRQATDEEMLPNALFIFGDTSGVVEQYTTDGLSEPHCFSSLTPGTYRVTMQPPEGYVNSGPADSFFNVGGPEPVEVILGAQRDPNAAAEGLEGDSEAAAEEEGAEDSGSSSAMSWVARIGGVLLLAVAIGVVVFFVISRRRA